MRHGGNPALKEYQYRSDRSESFTENLNVKVTRSTMEKLKAHENWRDLVREAVAEKLEKLASLES